MRARRSYGRCLIAGLVITLGTRAAHADPVAACGDAAEKAQSLRDARKLIEARDPLRVCAGSECPRFIQKDCARWLEEVERSLPTVVVTAKDSNGQYLVDVKVTVDGHPFASQLDGRAEPLNPGIHTFHFQRSDGTSVDQQVPIREGEKNQSVVASFEKRDPVPVAASAPVSGADHSVETTSPWRTIGWIAGGAGVVGLGLGATFGVLASSAKSDANCDAAGFCDRDKLASARDHATIANVGFIAGGILLAGGAALVLFAPGGAPGSARVTARANGMAFEGRW